jgi:hypothetical protein
MESSKQLHPDIERAIYRLAAKLVKERKATSLDLAKIQVMAEVDHASFEVLAGLVAEARDAGRTWPEIASHSDGSNPEALQRRFGGEKPQRVSRERFTATGERVYGLTETMKMTGLHRTTIQFHIDRDRERRELSGETGATWWADIPVMRGGHERFTPHVLDTSWLLENVKRKPRKRQVEL